MSTNIKRQYTLYVVIFLFIAIGNMFAWYYANNPMYISTWFYRLVGGGEFELGGLKIETPKKCTAKTNSRSVIALVSFTCAVTSKRLEGVDILKLFSAEENIKKRATKLIEADNYIYMIMPVKENEEGKALFHFYYLRRQNIIISSSSEELAKKFADLLMKYNFRINSIEESLNNPARNP